MRDSINSWQDLLANGFSTAKELLEFLNLPAALACSQAEKQFKTRVPRGFAQLMQPGNPADPLLLQVLPVKQELDEPRGYGCDPLNEALYNREQGLIHKYTGRVLLTLSGACAINCRYCFRRHFPYQDNNPGRMGWGAAFQYIERDPTISEVILSGGDPLLVTNSTLAEVLARLQTIAHLKTLRIHTRIPIVLPERIDAGLLAVLNACRLKKVVVLHSNHPRELDERVEEACNRLKNNDCTLLNQSVLLANVNDCPDVLASLSSRLFECGVLPYYLHVLDKVQGAAHFDLRLEQAKEIHKALQSRVAGYLVPRLACEVAGEAHKTWL